MKFKIILLLITYYLLLTALSPTVSAVSPTPEPSPAVQSAVSEEIKEIREAVKEKVREKLQEVKLGQKQAYVGKISQISEQSFTLKTLKTDREIKISDQAILVGKGGKKIEFKDLKIGMFCIAMGYVTDNNTMDARRVVVIDEPKVPNREVAVGKVTDISSEEKILTVKNERKGITYTVVANEKTVITKKGETKVEKANFSVIEIGDRIVAIGTVTENEHKLITAKIIHIIPGKAIGQTTSPQLTPLPTPEE